MYGVTCDVIRTMTVAEKPQKIIAPPFRIFSLVIYYPPFSKKLHFELRFADWICICSEGGSNHEKIYMWMNVCATHTHASSHRLCQDDAMKVFSNPSCKALIEERQIVLILGLANEKVHLLWHARSFIWIGISAFEFASYSSPNGNCVDIFALLFVICSAAAAACRRCGGRESNLVWIKAIK